MKILWLILGCLNFFFFVCDLCWGQWTPAVGEACATMLAITSLQNIFLREEIAQLKNPPSSLFKGPWG